MLRLEVAIQPAFNRIEVLRNERIISFLIDVCGSAFPRSAMVGFPVPFIPGKWAQAYKAVFGLGGLFGYGHGEPSLY